jgi:hypothetical protein
MVRAQHESAPKWVQMTQLLTTNDCTTLPWSGATWSGTMEWWLYLSHSDQTSVIDTSCQSLSLCLLSTSRTAQVRRSGLSTYWGSSSRESTHSRGSQRLWTAVCSLIDGSEKLPRVSLMCICNAHWCVVGSNLHNSILFTFHLLADLEVHKEHWLHL